MKLLNISKNNQCGFTLIELIVVIVILSMFLSVVSIFDISDLYQSQTAFNIDMFMYKLITSRQNAIYTDSNYQVNILWNSQNYSNCKKIIFDKFGRLKDECEIFFSSSLASTSIKIGYEGNIE